MKVREKAGKIISADGVISQEVIALGKCLNWEGDSRAGWNRSKCLRNRISPSLEGWVTLSLWTEGATLSDGGTFCGGGSRPDPRDRISRMCMMHVRRARKRRARAKCRRNNVVCPIRTQGDRDGGKILVRPAEMCNIL